MFELSLTKNPLILALESFAVSFNVWDVDGARILFELVENAALESSIETSYEAADNSPAEELPWLGVEQCPGADPYDVACSILFHNRIA